jgi:predicted ATPase
VMTAMALTELRVAGYRSLRDVRLPLGQLNVVVGPNGSGKSNLYRSLWLIAEICEGGFSRAICREGGLVSAMWAGARENKKPVRMHLGFGTEDFNFLLTCGFPPLSPTAFSYDPYIKEEAVWVGRPRKPSTTLLERSAGITWIRDAQGQRVEYPLCLSENESVLAQLREPHRFPELFALREAVRGWRFYHHFRTDDAAPLRSPQISVRTPVLSHDGSGLAAALQTIIEVGARDRLDEAITAGLPGRRLQIQAANPDAGHKSPQCTELAVALETDGCKRPLVARELSDGTLKFLCLAAALLSPRPPALIALNEPESSLHPDLLPPLAKMIVDAAEFSQIWISTHSNPLATAIEEISGTKPIELELSAGETRIRSPDE